MGINDINVEDITQVAEYINAELRRNRLQKDIETKDFKVNPGVIKNRLMRKGYKKINNEWVLNDNTSQTTKIIQSKSIEQPPKKVFNNNEIEKLDQLLKIDIDNLNKMINDYATKQNTKCSIKIENTETTVTSLRLNKEIYNKVRQYANNKKINLGDLFNDMMITYLSEYATEQ